MTTLFMAMAVLLLPAAPMLSILLMVTAYVAFRMTDPLGDMVELVIFYGAAAGVAMAFAGW